MGTSQRTAELSAFNFVRKHSRSVKAAVANGTFETRSDLAKDVTRAIFNKTITTGDIPIVTATMSYLQQLSFASRSRFVWEHAMTSLVDHRGRPLGAELDPIHQAYLRCCAEARNPERHLRRTLQDLSRVGYTLQYADKVALSRAGGQPAPPNPILALLLEVQSPGGPRGEDDLQRAAERLQKLAALQSVPRLSGGWLRKAIAMEKTLDLALTLFNNTALDPQTLSLRHDEGARRLLRAEFRGSLPERVSLAEGRGFRMLLRPCRQEVLDNPEGADVRRLLWRVLLVARHYAPEDLDADCFTLMLQILRLSQQRAPLLPFARRVWKRMRFEGHIQQGNTYAAYLEVHKRDIQFRSLVMESDDPAGSAEDAETYASMCRVYDMMQKSERGLRTSYLTCIRAAVLTHRVDEVSRFLTDLAKAGFRVSPTFLLPLQRLGVPEASYAGVLEAPYARSA